MQINCLFFILFLYNIVISKIPLLSRKTSGVLRVICNQTRTYNILVSIEIYAPESHSFIKFVKVFLNHGLQAVHPNNKINMIEREGIIIGGE